jgi:hypothetical protein
MDTGTQDRGGQTVPSVLKSHAGNAGRTGNRTSRLPLSRGNHLSLTSCNITTSLLCEMGGFSPAHELPFTLSIR